MRTIIYLRVSTEDQVERYGLPAQLRACREYAATHGLTIIEEISDEGISGAILERPGLDRVRRAVAAGAVDVVLMLDADRLSRELAHLLILKPEIEKRARLEFVAAKFEDSPSGRMFFGIRGVIAQYEREVTRERTSRGMVERARSGLLVGQRPPYGYTYDAGRLVANDDRAATVRSVFGWYEAGLSMREIARRLRDAGAPTWSGVARWSNQAVAYMLRNEAYAGMAHYTMRNDRVDLAVPALVSREQWQRVQARIDANPKVGRPSSYFLLRGVLFCGCARKMSPERHRSYGSYRCSRRDPLQYSGGICNRSVNARKLDTAAWSEISRAFGDSRALRSLLAEREKELCQDADKLPALHARAQKLRGQEETALSLMLDPEFAGARSEIKARYQQARGERLRVEAEIAAARVAPRLPAGKWLDRTTALLRDDLAAMNAEQRQRFIRSRMARAEWDGQELTMHVFFTPESAKGAAPICQFGPLQLVLKARLAA